ncbi:hypothetical protein EV385_1903 [Krasilnikovia cinnamomea]|uniref:Uncharacterized protein n=1 Tax=Krasilnikovia cinnamomea TaxID=349313 RepID=A0A4Q7ZH78_9ACTN|nr:hypothetical protein EV385_1903 [Krasilnikovia cinnamomea]
MALVTRRARTVGPLRLSIFHLVHHSGPHDIVPMAGDPRLAQRSAGEASGGGPRSVESQFEEVWRLYLNGIPPAIARWIGVGLSSWQRRRDGHPSAIAELKAGRGVSPHRKIWRGVRRHCSCGLRLPCPDGGAWQSGEPIPDGAARLAMRRK